MIINPEAVFNVVGIEKSWDEFEKFASENEDKLKSIEKHVAWDIWAWSRQALVVELPPSFCAEIYDVYEASDVKAAIDKAGVTCK